MLAPLLSRLVDIRKPQVSSVPSGPTPAITLPTPRVSRSQVSRMGLRCQARVGGRLCSESEGGVGRRWAPLGCTAWRPNLVAGLRPTRASFSRVSAVCCGRCRFKRGKKARDEKSAEGWDICTYVKDQLRCSTILFLRLMTAAVVKRYTCTVKSSSISVSERGKSGTRPGVPVVQANRTQSGGCCFRALADSDSQTLSLSCQDSRTCSSSAHSFTDRPPLRPLRLLLSSTHWSLPFSGPRLLDQGRPFDWTGSAHRLFCAGAPSPSLALSRLPPPPRRCYCLLSLAPLRSRD